MGTGQNFGGQQLNLPETEINDREAESGAGSPIGTWEKVTITVSC